MRRFVADGGLWLIGYLVLALTAATLDWLTFPAQQIFSHRD